MRFVLALITVVCCINANAQTGICFTSASDLTYPVPGVADVPLGLKSGDFNNDGIPDLATGSAKSVVVYYGRADGSLESPITISAGSTVSDVVAADFNMDGKMDIMTANAALSASLFLNNGHGLNAAISIPVPFGQRYGVADDFNNDNKPDILLSYPPQAVVLLGNGSGGFTTGPMTTVVWTTLTPAVTDFNSDGKKDLLIPNHFDNVVTLMLGNGLGGFTNGGDIAVEIGPQAAVAADLNSDGKKDAVVVNALRTAESTVGSITILLGNGAGVFTKSTLALDVRPVSVVAEDLNKDGKIDLAIAGVFSQQVVVYYGTGTGGFVKDAWYPVGEWPTNIIAVDLNGDSNLDLAEINQRDDDISILLATTPGKFNSEKVVTAQTTNSEGFRPGDLNSDGMLDFAIADGTNKVTVILATGPNVYAAPVSYAVGSGPRSVAVGDLNNDGKADLVAANTGSNSISILINNGDGTFAASVNKSGGNQPWDVVIKDMNKDGKPDILTANLGSSPAYYKGNGDGTFASIVSIPSGGGSMELVTGDLNKDGNEDVVTILYNTGKVSVMLANGAGGFLAPTLFSTDVFPQTIASADFNLDGNLDVVTGNNSYDAENNHDVSLLLGNGSGGFLPYTTIRTGVSNVLSVVAGDLNADGKPDIVAADWVTNSVSIFEGKGNGTFYPSTKFRTGFGTRFVELADFNQDSKPDIAVLEQGRQTVSTLFNTTAVITAAGPTVYCSGGSVVLNANTNGYSYSWNDGSSLDHLLADKSDVYSVRITNKSQQCSSISNEIMVIVGPAAVPGAYTTSTSRLCAGTSAVQYRVPLDRTVTYNWSYSGSNVTINGNTNSVTLNFGASATSGNLSVTATNTCGTSLARSISITVDKPLAVPGAFTTKSDLVCQDQSNVIYTVPNDPAVTYAWTYSGTGATLNATGNSTNVSFNKTATSGKVSVTATNTCGTSPARDLDVIVKPLPTKPQAFSTFVEKICRGSSAVAFETPNDPTVTYSWLYSGSGVVIDGTTNQVKLNFSNAATSGDLSVKATNSCGTSDAMSLAIIVDLPAATPAAFTKSKDVVCQGETDIEFAVPNDPAVTYNWTYSTSGVTINGNTNSVMVDLARDAVNGSLSVVAANSCGSSSARQLTMTVNPLPAMPGSIETLSAKICRGASDIAYAVANDPAVVYEWTYTGTGVTINGGTSHSVELDFSASASNGSLDVVAKNGCGASDKSSLDIIVEQPLATLSFTKSMSLVCTGQQDVAYEVTDIEGANYSWSYSGTGATIVDDNTSALVDYDLLATPGQLQVVAANSCGSGTPVVVDVTFRSIPGIPGAFTASSATVCEGTMSVPYSIPAEDNVSYLWKYSGKNAVISGSNYIVTLDFNGGATSGALSVVASNVCGVSPERKIDVTVNPRPAKPVIVKESTASIQILLKVNAEAQQYKWYKDGSILASASSKELDVRESGSYTVKVVTNDCESPLSDALNAVFVGLDDENYVSGAMSIYPNPVVNEIEIRFNLPGGQPEELSILDSKGSKVEEIKSPSRNITMPLHRYADGIYFIRVTIDSKVMVRKFVKVSQ